MKLCSSEDQTRTSFARFILFGRRELVCGAGGADCPVDRRPGAAGCHLPFVGTGFPSLRCALLSQSVLLVPPRAAVDHRYIRPDRGCPPRTPDGGGAHPAGLLQWPKVGIQLEPRPIQREGARADHHLCEFRGFQSLLYSHRERREDLLQAEDDLLGVFGSGFDHADSGFWMGRAFPKVLGRARYDVVAPKSGPGFSLQVPTLLNFHYSCQKSAQISL